MTSASSLAFPGSRTLAGWWRQLSPHQPSAMAFGHLFCHRVEAAVAVERLQSVDRLSRLILEALELESASAKSNDELLHRLKNHSYLEASFLHQILRRLHASGLVDMAPRWAASELGRHALRQGHYTSAGSERRLFHFLEHCDAQGSRTRTPQYVHMRDPHGNPWHCNAMHAFDPAWLRSCLEQTDDWKEARGFPRDVTGFPRASLQDVDADWRQVVVDYPEQLQTVLIRTGGSRVLGFSVKQEGWQLQATQPLLVLERDWEPLFPELIPPSPEALAGAWSAWAEAHGLSTVEATACTLTMSTQHLRVQAPVSALQRMHNLRGENWLLLGDGYLRLALQLEM